MTQRIFDTDNEEDMRWLWNILPDDVNKIKKHTKELNHFYKGADVIFSSLIKINWHGKKEITRPVNYEDMIGCVGWFKHHKETVDGGSVFGILDKYNENDILGKKFHCRSNTWFEYFTPAKKSELKFWEE